MTAQIAQYQLENELQMLNSCIRFTHSLQKTHSNQYRLDRNDDL